MNDTINYEITIVEPGEGNSRYYPYAPCQHSFKEKTLQEALSKEQIECADCGCILSYKVKI